jgi:hypothetical protein
MEYWFVELFGLSARFFVPGVHGDVGVTARCPWV